MAKFRFKTNKRKSKLFGGYSDAVSGIRKIAGARIEVISNKEISVDGCKSIAEYTDGYVKIRTNDGFVTVFGSDFSIPMFDGPLLTVEGNISSIEFCVR